MGYKMLLPAPLLAYLLVLFPLMANVLVASSSSPEDSLEASLLAADDIPSMEAPELAHSDNSNHEFMIDNLQNQLHYLDKKGFYQWSGKRSGSAPDDDDDLVYQLKRGFYSFAGKRNGGGLESNEGTKADKRGFYQWSGKRSSSAEESISAENERPMSHKRGFYAFAGKRSMNESPDSMSAEFQPISDEDTTSADAVIDQNQDKRGFYQWSGKRSLSNDLLKEQNQEFAPQKRQFYAWKGKRNLKNEGGAIEEKRGFYQWGG